MIPTLILMVIGITIGSVLPYDGSKYVIQTDLKVAGSSAILVEQPLPVAENKGSIPSQSLKVKASWYGVKEYCEKYNPKCIMANGQKLDDEDFTAACGSQWVLGDMVSISHNGKTVIVECTDRGSFEEKYGRVLDLSKAAFSALAPLSKGVIEVEIN